MQSINTKIVLGIILVAVIVFAVIRYSLDKIDYKNEIVKQDLRLKCQEVYTSLHGNVESTRYGEEQSATVIWSPKTKTCLAYYNIPQNDRYSYLFEVWDYTNNDLVLSYSSENSKECMENGIETDKQNFIYKYNKKLEGTGCGFPQRKNGIDLLTNFEKAMLEIGFKR